MRLTYLKRFCMELDLRQRRPLEPVLPEGYCWIPWQPDLVLRHAQAKFESFRAEIDSRVFPCLGDLSGCLRLMEEISQRPGFLPQTTWLVARCSPEGEVLGDCGTIQGLVLPEGFGAVQNIGVVPEHRGLGLGRALLLKALRGFCQADQSRVRLEVTAQNHLAVDLYRSVGFRAARTVYKPVHAEPAVLT